MAARTRPRGSVKRNPPDWFARYIVGSWANAAASVGNLSLISLFNNATDGSVLRVYTIGYAVGTACQVYYKSIYGSVGTQVSGLSVPGVQDPRTPQQWGQVFSANPSTAQGSPFLAATAYANQWYADAPGFPIAIIPPGWSFGLESSLTNNVLNAAFRWLSAYD